MSSVSRLFEELSNIKDTKLHQGVDASLIDKLEKDCDLTFPSEYKDLLRLSNGIEAYAGYIRLFGLYATESIDAAVWNHPDYWKFAWEDRCSDYWCLGETAWGDQYGYSLDDLRSGRDATIGFLSAYSMSFHVVASCFTEFLENEFIRSAKEPYDVMLKQARQRFGLLEVEDHIVYNPSILLGGTEDIDNVQKMNARAAMICNGDIATQLDIGPPHRAVKAVETYEDELNRIRIRLVWT